jgi:hypothetical protein
VQELYAVGQATLYPYNVPEGPDVPGYRGAYRNNSTSGVTVRVETAVSGASTTSIGFEVTSLHIEGNYAFKVSLECQSLYPDANATISTPTVTDIGPNGATIHVAFARGLFVNDQDYSYYVQYGTKPAVYDNQTAAVAGVIHRPILHRAASGSAQEHVPACPRRGRQPQAARSLRRDRRAST